MSQPAYVFGIFENTDCTGQILEDLHKAGFKSADLSVVGKDCREFHNQSAKIKSPMAKYFVRYGIVGALGGLWAGVTMAPQLPYPGFFQIITTVMAAVSGAVILAYFGIWIGAFLHANEPQYYANVFEGEIENGQVVVLAETSSKEERRAAWEIMDSYDAVEIITRQADLGQIIGLEKVSNASAEEQTRPQLVAVA